MNVLIKLTQVRGGVAGTSLVIRQSQIGAEGPTESAIVVPASENLSAGDFVNLWPNAGVMNVRKATAAQPGYECSGFVITSVTAGQSVTVYLAGKNNLLSGLTLGPVFLSTTPGLVSSSPPTVSGQVVQPVGYAISPSAVMLQLGLPIRLG
jgi:hypothetical protein